MRVHRKENVPASSLRILERVAQSGVFYTQSPSKSPVFSPEPTSVLLHGSRCRSTSWAGQETQERVRHLAMRGRVFLIRFCFGTDLGLSTLAETLKGRPRFL